MPNNASDRGLDIYVLGQAKPQDGWLVSDWAAGQTSIMRWSDDNVRVSADGYVELVLDRAPDGSSRPWEGGEIQNTTATKTGTWSWTAQAPEMAPGAVFGMFTYKSDWKKAPWTEFDFEFVGNDTTRVELNIHMIDASGKHVTLAQNKANKTIIDLGFDASKGVHTYEVSVTETGATFYIDGKTVGDFTGADMPGGTWNLAAMNSYVDLWAAPNAMVGWTGKWIDPGRPLVAKIFDAEIRNGEYGSEFVPPTPPVEDGATDPVVGSPDDDTKDGPDGLPTGSPEDGSTGNGGEDAIYGLGGNDVIDGRSGTGAMHGMMGDDTYWVDDRDDRTIENPGEGHDQVNASLSWTLASHIEALELQDKLHIDGSGNDLGNTLIGSGGRNMLGGLAGDDFLDGQRGQDILFAGIGSDTLVGGRGIDDMHGGSDQDSDTFVFSSFKESRAGQDHDRIHDFISGIDKLDFSRFDANESLIGKQDLIFSGSSASAYAVWTVNAGMDLLLQADIDGNDAADFEILVKNIATLSTEDFLF